MIIFTERDGSVHKTVKSNESQPVAFTL